MRGGCLQLLGGLQPQLRLPPDGGCRRMPTGLAASACYRRMHRGRVRMRQAAVRVARVAGWAPTDTESGRVGAPKKRRVIEQKYENRPWSFIPLRH